MTRAAVRVGRRGWLGPVAIATGMCVAVVLLLLWLAGFFHEKIAAGEHDARAGRAAPAGLKSVEVREVRLPRSEGATGTIQPVYQTALASKLLARVRQIEARAGQVVRTGDLLVQLDDADLKARVEQSSAAVDAAAAARDQARIEHERIAGLREQNAASEIELQRAETALKTAEAEMARATNARREAETTLGYATVRSPIDGIVVDKRVDAGDTVMPGQTLVGLYDPTRMQLVARVRESLTRHLKVGQTIDVRIDSLERVCQGQVSEIVPEAESVSRTFSVKVTGSCPPDVYSGMFARLLIPLEEERVLVIPAEAVRHVGQLDLVEVVEKGALERRVVQLGRTLEAGVEVLSGLRAGERVAVREGA